MTILTHEIKTGVYVVPSVSDGFYVELRMCVDYDWDSSSKTLHDVYCDGIEGIDDKSCLPTLDKHWELITNYAREFVMDNWNSAVCREEKTEWTISTDFEIDENEKAANAVTMQKAA